MPDLPDLQLHLQPRRSRRLGRACRGVLAAGSALGVWLGGASALAHPAGPPHGQGGWGHAPLLAAPAPPQPVDPPLRMTVREAGGKTLRGAMTAFDVAGFLFVVRGEDDARRFPWEVLPPARVVRIHDRLLDRDDGEAWLRLGAALYLRDAAEPGEEALERALRAAPALATRAALAREGQPIGDAASPDADADPAAEADPDAESAGPGTPSPAGGPAAPRGPVAQGETQNAFWGTLSDGVMRSSTLTLLNSAEQTRAALGLDLAVYAESKYYLFVSDMRPGEARRWAGLLDRLYDRLCDTFAVPRGTNVFRGRGLIYVFRREADYHRFHQEISNFNSTGSAGLCKSFGNGHVEISFYRQASDGAFSNVLVHEAVHGFLHRYRSSPHVVSWANEGLAEFVAADFVGLFQPQQVRNYVASTLRARGSTGGMLGDQSIQGWQYPVAQALCDFMIAQDRGRYRDFINAIKDGKPWRKALEEDYGVPPRLLLTAFGQALGLPDLRN